MTNEQLTNKVIELMEHQAKCDIEKKEMHNRLDVMEQEIKDTKALAEDVHIMAVNMQNMQKTLDITVQKINSIEKKDYNEYQESKKIVKNNILSGITGAIVSGLIALVIFIISKMKDGDI